MLTVGAYKAKTHLSELLDRVSKGEVITITKHGVPVAVLQPPYKEIKADRNETINAIKEFQSKHTINGLSIKEMIEEGRR